MRLALVSCVLNALTYAFDFPDLSPYILASKLANGAYFAIIAMLPCLWSKYTVMVIGAYQQNAVIKQTLFYLPAFIMTFCGFASVWTGWIFSIDDNNIYERGPMYGAYILVVFGYMVFSSCVALRRALMKKFYANRQMYTSLASFGIFAMVGILLEFFIENLPASAMGLTMTLMTNCMSIQKRQISTDPLTKLNNRNQFNAYLSKSLENLDREKKLFLFMLDMDKFKQINDKFGHLEGDRALLIVSNVLKRMCGPRGLFISRFGGDEFALIGRFKSESECGALIEDLNQAMSSTSVDFVSPLSLSIGYAAANESGDNIPDFFKRADAKLYVIKAARKAEQSA